tara:strand:- start:108 stop:368 length:261 start_codon:yes stop_codon:yes gene_type:complete
MAKIKTDDKEIEVKDGDSIKDVCEELGVIVACGNGSCGICKVEVEEGMENLNKLTNEEKEFGLEKNERLACQCKIKSGEVKIKVLT